MSWVTIIWSMNAAVCLTLAGIHLLVWFKQRRAWRNLLFSLTAVATALRRIHVTAWAPLVSLVGFVGLCLHSGGPWLVLLCGLFALDAYAAKPSIHTDPTYLIDTWETEDGLPENSATAMVQTPDGYLWFGTFNGLVRFDGVRFTVFNRANTPQLPSAGIVNLHVDQRGWLWISTLGGMAVLADNKWRTFGTNKGWAGNYVRTSAERRNGDLLFTTFDGNVLEFANGRLGQLPNPPGEQDMGYWGCVDETGQWWVAQHRFIGHWDGLRWVQMVAVTGAISEQVGLTAARDGGLWLLLNNVLLKYRGGTEVSRLQMPEFLGAVWSMSEDSHGNVWICTTDRGIFQVSSAGKMRRWTTTNGLSSDRTRFVFEDRENNLWVGTSGGGLQRFKPKRFYTLGAEQRELQQVVSSVSSNAAGDVWIATYGRGLFRRSASELTEVPLPGERDVTRFVQSVLEDRLGRVWAGTYLGGLWLLGKQDPRMILAGEADDNDFTALFEDSRGGVWIASGRDACVYDGGSFRVFGPKDGLPRGPISCFAEDSSGAVWLAHQDGVFRLVKDRFTLMNDETGLPLSDIACLQGDGSGAMWMGSLTLGLIRWREGKFATVGAAAGLPMHAIYSIVEDKHGNWWMTSDAGVVRAGLADLRAAADNPAARVRCQVLDKSDGLPGTDFSTGRQPLSSRDAAGKLWFAMSKGVAMIDPEKFFVNEKPPPTHIEEVSYFLPGSGPANGRQVELRPPFPEKVFLPPGSRRLEISYTGLSFVSAEKVRFQVKLEREDAEWLEAGNRRVAHYYDLQPRDYLFRVRATNNDGVWNEAGASLAFAVQPLFWQTLWFKALGLVALAALVYGGFHRRVTRLEKEHAAQQAFTRQVILSEENERKRIAGELHDGLGQDLLLIKNRLALAAARQSDAAEHTRQLDAATAATTRAIREVRAISHALRPIALEQVGLTKAIESMLTQLGEGSATKFAAELDKIDGLLAPEMEINLFRIIQECLNNITRHAGAAQVILEVKREEPGLCVSLFDDGCGFDADKLGREAGARQGLGLAGMNERVKYLAGSLDLQSAPGRGTRVTVRVPLPGTRV